MEEAEVKIDVADMVMDQLVTETAEFLLKAEHKSSLSTHN